MIELNFLKRLPSESTSFKKMFLLFGISFLVILFILRLPVFFSQAKYAATHDEDQNYEQMTEEYRQLYGYHGQIVPSSAATAAATSTSTSSPTQPTENGNYISIPKINVKAPILETNNLNPDYLDGLLKKGVLLYPGSTLPGGRGTTAIVGHSSSNPPWTKYSTIFSLLGRLEIDDLIYLHFQGQDYIYSVSAKKTGTVAELEQFSGQGDLILSSCWPIGSDRGRILINAARKK